MMRHKTTERKLLENWAGRICDDGITIVSKLNGHEVHWQYIESRQDGTRVATKSPDWADCIVIVEPWRGEIGLSRRLSREAAIHLMMLSAELIC